MDNHAEESEYEDKIDNVMELLEEIILDALLAALRKIRDRNIHFCELLQKMDEEGFPF